MISAERNIDEYPVMEQFYTLQGEGYHAGKAACFIRLGGCDVGCVWCDVKESWDAEKHAKINTKQMVNSALKHAARLAVITGGEPAMYDLTPICVDLHNAGFKTHIETSGAYPIIGDFDWVTVSPKKFKKPLDESLVKADELKIVVYNKYDFDWAELYAEKVSGQCRLYLQPEWSKKEEIIPQIINYIEQHPKWQLSLQQHKYINIP
jgi:organic radical activating enzyme